MHYLYESLTDQSFQKLCQALVVAEHPDAMCLPVDQPDGGRDAFTLGAAGKISTVFQVKFTLQPGVREEREQVESLVKGELKKIRRLKDRGLEHYYLITNVSSTGHLDVGFADKVNAILTEIVGVKTTVWWRDDLDARLDNNYSVKLSFPAVLRGTDAIQAIIQSGDSKSCAARQDAVRAYIAYQHGKERLVKFTQVDLENSLIDLFTDPSIEVHGNNPEKQSEINSQHQRIRDGIHIEQDDLGLKVQGGPDIMATQFLISNVARSDYRNVVLLGGPGQGKSTVTQYVCQINRIKILSIATEFDQLPAAHAAAPIRVPFKVDLRDYAVWVRGLDPFYRGSGPRPETGQPSSLEAYIARQVEVLSGGHAFSVPDFCQVIREAPAIIVLDGFDEIADIELRNSVVEEISNASQRLAALSAIVQTIVTSRPTAFANADNFDSEEWSQFEISDLSVAGVLDYATRWCKSRGLESEEIQDFRSSLELRLSEGHIRDLSKNAMQMTILLVLIKAKGEALPDKRTDLYRSYLDHFLDREASKWPLVKKYRDDIVEIHGHIAWLLQTRAEALGEDGRISEAEFKLVVSQYLKDQRYEDVDLDGLFTSVTQRIVAIVSRVEGTYEFEVQPLREYFAGQYLYTTARYSSLGREAGGTLPDRLSAIISRKYWNNTVRFYSGFYNKGEIPSIVETFTDSGTPIFDGYLKLLGLRLVGDWVLNQSTASREALVNWALSDDGAQDLWAETYGPDFAVSCLSDRCGRGQLVEKLTTMFLASERADERVAIGSWLAENMTSKEILDLWDIAKNSSQNLLRDATSLDMIGYAPVETLRYIINNSEFDTISWLIAYGRIDSLHECEGSLISTIDYILDHMTYEYISESPNGDNSDIRTLLKSFTACCTMEVYNYPINLKEELLQRSTAIQATSGDLLPDIENLHFEGELESKVLNFTREMAKLLQDTAANWLASPDNWLASREIARRYFGDRWTMLRAQLMSGLHIATPPAKLEPFRDNKDFNAVWFGLHCRENKSIAFWWKNILPDSIIDNFAKEAILSVFAYADTGVFEDCFDEIELTLAHLSDEDVSQIYSDLGSIRQFRRVSGQFFSKNLFNPKISSKFAFLLTSSASDPELISLIVASEACQNNTTPEFSRRFVHAALQCVDTENEEWATALNAVSKNYHSSKKDVIWLDEFENLSVPVDVAKSIYQERDRYPLSLVNLAVRSMRIEKAKSLNSVLEVSRLDNWFS